MIEPVQNLAHYLDKGENSNEEKSVSTVITFLDPDRLDDVPGVFASVTEFAASDTCAQTVIADTDGFVLERVGKVVFSFRHGPDEHADTFRSPERVDVIPDSDHVGVETQGDLPAIGWEVVRDGILDDLEEFFLRVDRSDG